MNAVTLKLANTLCSRIVSDRLESGTPQPDVTLNKTVQLKNDHYRQNYTEVSESVVFMSVSGSTFGRINEDFLSLMYLHTHWEGSTLTGEFPEESDQFRFIRAACLANLKGSIGLMLAKVSVMRVTIPLHLSTRSFIPLPRFIHSRNTTPL